MEIFEAKKTTDETLTGVNDDPHTDLKPNLAESVGDLGSVVVKTSVFQKTEVSVVKMIQDDKDDEFMKNQEQGKGDEVLEDEKEGGFANLFDFDDDNDDGMNVKCSENEASQAMDVDVSLTGEKASGLNLGFDATVGFTADENDENGTKIFEPKDDANKNGEENVEIREDIACELAENKEEFNREQGENASDVNLLFEGNTGFLADEHDGNASGDPMDINLSVEKDKNHENGTKIFDFKDDTNKNGEENVEIREDITTELAENKEEFNGEQIESKDEEVEEDHGFVVGDLVWGKIKGQTWWPGQIYDPSDASDNAAKSERTGRLLVAYFGDGSFSWCSPSQLKPLIDHFPEMLNHRDSKKCVSAVQTALVEVSRLVEAGLMCKCQTVNRVDGSGAVNRGIKRGVVVPKGNTVKILMDRIEPVELLLVLKASAVMDPCAGLDELELALLKSCLNVFYRKNGGVDDDMRSGVRVVADSDVNGSSGSIEYDDGKLYVTRKQKSVADLLKDEPKIKKTKTRKDGGSGIRKRKELVVLVTPESDHESSGGGGGEDETMSPRRRKKSKYLSPPYLSPIGGGKLSVFSSGSGLGSGSFKEPKLEPEKAPEMAAKQLEDLPKKSSGKKTRQTRDACDGSDSQEQKKTFDAAVNMNKVLHGLLRVARDPTSFVDKNAPAVTDFCLTYRNTVFGETSSYLADKKKIKKNGRETSDLGFIKQQLESMIGIVRSCEEADMNADVKASLEGGMQEVLEKVGKIK